jgi:hypothetical protein
MTTAPPAVRSRPFPLQLIGFPDLGIGDDVSVPLCLVPECVPDSVKYPAKHAHSSFSCICLFLVFILMNSPITIPKHTFHQEKQQLFSQLHNTLFSDENTNSISKFHFSSEKTPKIRFSFYCVLSAFELFPGH